MDNLTLNEITNFINECEMCSIKIPTNLTVVCEDFYENVPKNMHTIRPIEFNHSKSKLNIIPNIIKI